MSYANSSTYLRGILFFVLNFPFSIVKISIYLNNYVFIMFCCFFFLFFFVLFFFNRIVSDTFDGMQEIDFNIYIFFLT